MSTNFLFDIKYKCLESLQDYEDYCRASNEAFGASIPKIEADKDISKILLDDKLVGYITFVKCDEKELGLSNFIILPEFRNCNYGSLILTDVINSNTVSYDTIFCFVNIFNEDAIRFYNRFGTVIEKRTPKNEYLVIFRDRYNSLKQSIIEKFHDRLTEEKKVIDKLDVRMLEDYSTVYDTIRVYISDKTRDNGWEQELEVVNHSISDTIKALRKQIGYKYNIEYLGPGKTHKNTTTKDKKYDQLSLFDTDDTKPVPKVSLYDFDEAWGHLVYPKNIPSTLYHATFKAFIPYIKKYGLGNTNRTLSTESVPGVVYLTTDPEVALSYAALNELELDRDYGDVVLLKVDTTYLDKTKFYTDTDLVDNTAEKFSTVEYHGIIDAEYCTEILTEATRNQLIAKSRNGAAYVDQSKGKNRFERKRLSKVANQVKSYNQIDMNDLFKRDELQVVVPVVGETGTYEVTIRFNGVLSEIAKNIKNNKNIFEYKCVFQALTKLFNTANVYVNCNCKDFKYNFDHWSIVNGFGVNDTAHDPGPGKGIRNPDDNKGTGCKHVLLVLANVDWLVKVASVVNNYINYASQNMKQAFIKVIFPKLYGVTVDAASEEGLVPEDVKLETTSNIIDTINDYGRNRGKYTKGSNKNPVTGTGGRAKKAAEEKPEEKPNEANKDDEPAEEADKSA